jgi:hypothetical protein
LLRILYSRTVLEEKMSEKNLQQAERDSMLGELAKKETEFIRFRRLRLTHNEFENIRLIGRGAFGEVRSLIETCNCRHLGGEKPFPSGDF